MSNKLLLITVILPVEVNIEPKDVLKYVINIMNKVSFYS